MCKIIVFILFSLTLFSKINFVKIKEVRNEKMGGLKSNKNPKLISGPKESKELENFVLY